MIPPRSEVIEKPSPAFFARRLGEHLASRYRLDRLLAAGGQGAVYGARDTTTDVDVAVKVFHPKIGSDHVTRARMLREAEALMALRGTGAITALDHGWTRAGEFFLATELLTGKTLEEHARDEEKRGERVPAETLAAWLGPIVDTLELAHAKGFVHRDMKPSNVFLSEQNGAIEPRLLDFGYAKVLGQARVTDSNLVLGSPPYVAPESWLGEPPDARGDAYALGVLVFRVLTGRTPIASKKPGEIMQWATSATRPSLSTLRPDLGTSLDEWILRSLAIQPQDRFNDVRSMYRAFVTALGLP